MKKFYSLLLLLTICVLNLNAQRQTQSVKNGKKELTNRSLYKKATLKNLNKFNQNAEVCTWLNPLDTFSLSIYQTNAGGFLAGTNDYGDVAKANYFDFSQTTITKLDSIGIMAYVDVSDFTLPIYLIVYDGTSGEPGAKLAQINTTCQVIADAMDEDGMYTVKLTTPLTLPASKKIFIAVDFSGLSWEDFDDFSLFSTTVDMPKGIAWEQWDDLTWEDMDIAWSGLKTALTIFPYVCGDVTTPVALGQLAASNNTLGNTISWSSVSETANKGFEVQRSTDGINFTTIAFVASKAINGNSNTTIQYSYLDENPAIGENYYRVKQVDLNSNSSFSNVAKIIKGLARTEGVTLYPNPAKDRVNIALNSLNGKKSTITVFNNNGKSVRQISLLGTGALLNTSINLDGLANGLYFIKVETDGKTESSRFVKN